MSRSASRAQRLLRAMRGRRVLVFGDVMLDQFLWGRVGRISPEAPVPVVQVTDETHRLGGAANVARNVRSLGGEAVLVGVVGRDAAAQRMHEDLDAAGIEARLVAADDRPTTTKTRIVAHHQQVVRADREVADPVDPATTLGLRAALRAALAECGSVVISDYDKGVVSPELTRFVLGAARRRGCPVLVDPKVGHFRQYRRAALVTPNQAEAEQATGVRIRGDADVVVAGERLLEQLAVEAALITRGEHGMSLFRRGRRPVHLPTAAREVFDVTGAGDTVIATLGLAVAAGADLPLAATLANHAAGVVVGKLGTATAEPDEISAALAAR